MLKRSLALILLLVMALTLAAGCAGPSEAREAQAPEDQKAVSYTHLEVEFPGRGLALWSLTLVSGVEDWVPRDKTL